MELLPAIVPAAGLSSRMGSAKPLLDAGGTTFLHRILTSLRQGGAGPVLVVVRELEGSIADIARAEEAVVLPNPTPETGPISSLQAGISQLPCEAPGTLFCPADHPLFLPETVRALIAAFFRHKEREIVVPVHGGLRGHPVVFGRAIFPEFLEENLPQGARTVVHRYVHRRLEVPVNDPGILADIDTPADYRRHFP